MREILFRGKRLDNGEWVEGSLIIDHYDYAGQHKDRYVIQNCLYGIDENGFCDFQSGISEEIDPLTLGQYTGLTDKNGRKIFEGDLLRGKEYDGERDVFGAVRWDAGGNYELVNGDGCTGFSWLSFDRLEVVGNVYDNPELVTWEVSE